MNPTLDERHEIWRRFLQRWPLEALGQMTLAQFAQTGDQDSFSHWVETVADALGPTGSSSPLPWSNYLGGGEGAEVAFEKLLVTVMQIARAARTGDVASLEKADLDPVAKWKLAFLYQNPEAPCVLPLYEKQSLQAISGPDVRRSFRAMQSQLLAERGVRDVLAYGDTL